MVFPAVNGALNAALPPEVKRSAIISFNDKAGIKNYFYLVLGLE